MEYLESEKNIVIVDKQRAKELLQSVGYFPLISGYKELFRIPFTKKYKPETSFDEIAVLYQFDADLRSLFLKHLLQVERHIGNLIAHYFVEQYGISQSEYLNPTHYNNTARNRKTISVLMKKLYGAVTSTDYAYINHYRTKYGNIPLWITTSVLTFGSLSKMYNVLTQSLRSKICRHFPEVNQRQLERFLSVLTKYRNVCAHNDRLFTYRTVEQILDTPLHSKLNIPVQGNQYIYGKQDLFSVVIAFRYLLSKEDFINFKKALTSEISKATKVLVHIIETELLEHMGFPRNWKSISCYSK